METPITIFATHPVVTTAMTLRARRSKTVGLSRVEHIADSQQRKSPQLV